jgi:hypothetical protein
MNQNSFCVSIFAAGFFIAISMLIPNLGLAQIEQMDKLKADMAALIAKTAELGSPNIEGTYPVCGKSVPGLYFGNIKMNNVFDVVDEVSKEHGAFSTIFVKDGSDYVSVASTIKRDDGSRAIGTVLDPNGPAIAMINKGKAYYGEATILGKPYITAYEPIRDAANNVIGIYFVGFMK